MSIQPEELRSVMRYWATGVTVVTAQHAGVRHGMTVNSFTSISLGPPLVLVSLEQTARTHDLVKEAGNFGITLLAEGQQQISDIFAGRQPGHIDRFEGLETFVLVSGAPLLRGGLAFLDCRVVSTYAAATHTLFIAEVVAAQSNPENEAQNWPLLYYNRTYRGMQK
jgi:flavin reductase (DIM6/NTAB) family NADH-FMN oxidoreductase RutF